MNAVPRLPHLPDMSAVVVFFLLFLIGCTGESGSKDYALHITPLPPERGKEISISYDRHSGNAKFKEERELYATINVKNQYGVDSYRIQLAVTDGIHRGTFLVPMDACYLDIAVAPYEQVMFTETFGSVVYENGLAVEHALPHLITSARSYEEAKTLYRRDETTYPHSTDRYQPMWISRITFGIDTVDILQEIDSLYTSVIGTRGVNEEAVTSLAACASSYYALGRYKDTKKAIVALSVLTRHQSPLPLAALRGIASILFDYTERCMRGEEILIAGDLQDIISAIYTIIDNCKDFNLATLLLRNAQLCKQSHVGRALWNDSGLQDRFLRLAHEIHGSDNIRAMEFISGLAVLLSERGRHRDIVSLLQERIDELRHATCWMRDAGQKIVSNFPAHGHFADIQRIFGIALLEVGERSNGAHVLEKLLETQVRSENVYSLRLAAEYLATYYTKDAHYDRAEKYLAYTVLLESTRSKTLYDELQKKLTSAGRPSIDGESFLKKHFASHLVESKRIPDIDFETERGLVSLSIRTKDPLILLFYSSDCSVCKPVLRNVLKGMSPESTRQHRIIVVSDVPKDQLISSIGSISTTFEYAALNSEILRAFNVPGFPYAVVLRDGIMKFHGMIDEVFGARKLKALLN